MPLLEGLPLIWFAKVGPSPETKEETVDLYSFMGWDSNLNRPQFMVIPTVSFIQIKGDSNKVYDV